MHIIISCNDTSSSRVNGSGTLTVASCLELTGDESVVLLCDIVRRKPRQRTSGNASLWKYCFGKWVDLIRDTDDVYLLWSWEKKVDEGERGHYYDWSSSISNIKCKQVIALVLRKGRTSALQTMAWTQWKIYPGKRCCSVSADGSIWRSKFITPREMEQGWEHVQRVSSLTSSLDISRRIESYET